MRKCIRCGTEMIESGHITGAGFKLNDREFKTYPIKTQDIYDFCDAHGFDRKKAFRRRGAH